MRTAGAALVAIGLCAFASACGSSSPTTPSSSQAAAPDYAGQWSGTTSQGRSISFTVSPQQVVTAITLDYNLDNPNPSGTLQQGNCSGSSTFSNLHLLIVSPAGPALGPGFAYASGSFESPNFIELVGFFGSNTAATGAVTFLNYDCGPKIVGATTAYSAMWTASKQ
jgi:hypothetical protein